MLRGEVASRAAITILLDLVLRTPDWILRLSDDEFVAEVIHRTKIRYANVNAELLAMAKQDPTLEGMATTLTITANVGDTLIITHIGDSRAYLLRAGALMQLTRDHTLVQDLVDKGVLTREQGSTHKQKHVLTNALGISAKHLRPDVQRLSLQDGDYLLLCTDGLSTYVDKHTMQNIMESGESVDRACQRLLEAALDAGGRDNITLVLARYRRQI